MFTHWLITSCIILRTVCAFQPGTDLKYSLMNQGKTGPTPFNTLTVDHVLSCAVICEDDPLCAIFAFHADRQQCNIYHQLITASELQDDPGMRMFKIRDIGENIAYLKTTEQSSMHGDKGSSLAVDGNTMTTCFITEEGDFSPYFMVDLADIYHVLYVTIYNTPDSNNYPERLHDVNIELYLNNPSVGAIQAHPVCCGFMSGRLPSGPNLIKCQDGVMGRFVKIFIEKSELMTLCEVEVTGHKVDDLSSQQNACNVKECKRLPNGPNIALGKPTTQSSNYNSWMSSSLAVDGNRNGDVLQYSCSITHQSDHNPWLLVDLERMYNITSVTIVNRRDGRAGIYERMTDTWIQVFVYDPITTTATPTICKFIPGIFGLISRTFECDDVTIGRYVRVTKKTVFLEICELEVTGTLV